MSKNVQTLVRLVIWNFKSSLERYAVLICLDCFVQFFEICFLKILKEKDPSLANNPKVSMLCYI